jgi:hypothetical protein
MFLFKLIAQISRFNLIPIDHIVNSWFYFTKENEDRIVVNENYHVMGYDSSNLLQTLDTVILFMVGILVMIVITFFVDMLVPMSVK